MGIPESQLEIWSHQGAITTAKMTANSIRNTLNTYDLWPDNIDYKVYLQGSYRNSTNIRGDSDVDVIAHLNASFYSNLSQEQKRYLGITSVSYGWEEFRRDTLNALREHYGSDIVQEGNKSIKIKTNDGRLPADLVVCAQYRNYTELSIDAYIEGMTFWTRYANRQIINYPKIHYENGVTKHQNTDNWYKPAVRMFKNMRSHLTDKDQINGNLAPSYFMECLLYNVPNDKFHRTYQDTFCAVVNWINSISLGEFFCQNERLRLFGPTPEQWSEDKAKSFIQNLILLWNNWTNQ